MSTATEVAKTGTKEGKVVEYTPLGSKSPVQLSIGMVRSFLCVPTRSGKHPTDADVVKFMMLCKARELDPWTGDAYLTGFDSSDGPQFSLITAVQALYKRAEMNMSYDGTESGVIVTPKDGGEPVFRSGDLVLPGETLVGGWARCHRKDRDIPSYDALNLSVFDTKRSRWAKDPAGMIVKCAEASVLRKSFPTQLGGLYTQDEMELISEQRMQARGQGVSGAAVKITSLDALSIPAPSVEQHRVEQQHAEQQHAEQPQQSNATAEQQHADVGDAYEPQDEQPVANEVDAVLGEWEEAIASAKNKKALGELNQKLIGSEKRLTNDQKLPLLAKINAAISALK